MELGRTLRHPCQPMLWRQSVLPSKERTHSIWCLRLLIRCKGWHRSNYTVHACDQPKSVKPNNIAPRRPRISDSRPILGENVRVLIDAKSIANVRTIQGCEAAHRKQIGSANVRGLIRFIKVIPDGRHKSCNNRPWAVFINSGRVVPLSSPSSAPKNTGLHNPTRTQRRSALDR